MSTCIMLRAIQIILCMENVLRALGRAQFARDHGIDVDTETRTVEEFIELTRNAYAGEVTRHLEGAYKRTEPPKEEA